MNKKYLAPLLLLIMLLLVACSNGQATSEAEPTRPTESETVVEATNTPKDEPDTITAEETDIPAAEPTEETAQDPYPVEGVEETQPEVSEPANEAYPPPEDFLPEPTPEATVMAEIALPLGPEPLTLITPDGLTLVGDWYPAENPGAPVVILFHQFGYDRQSWDDLALWMQNRTENTFVPGGVLAVPAAQYAWFPEFPTEIGSLNVVAFDFRNHGESDNGSAGRFDPAGFLLDANAILGFVKQMDFIDTTQIVIMGASFGADAAVDACVVTDGTTVSARQLDKGCIGALSFSPGSFLDVPYSDAVDAAMKEPHQFPVTCLSAKNDTPSPETCGEASGETYESILFEGDKHGVDLIEPGLTPNIGQVIIDFLQRVLLDS